jgi:hypothetical protein
VRSGATDRRVVRDQAQVRRQPPGTEPRAVMEHTAHVNLADGDPLGRRQVRSREDALWVDPSLGQGRQDVGRADGVSKPAFRDAWRRSQTYRHSCYSR